jgi:magnesium chelatase family protein
VPPIEYRELANMRLAEPSSAVRERVIAARCIQLERFAGDRIYSNARMTRRQVRKHCPLDQDGQLLIRQAMDALGFSARAYDRILKVARTIADLEASIPILPQHVSEAINYRTLDRRLE